MQLPPSNEIKIVYQNSMKKSTNTANNIVLQELYSHLTLPLSQNNATIGMVLLLYKAGLARRLEAAP